MKNLLFLIGLFISGDVFCVDDISLPFFGSVSVVTPSDPKAKRIKHTIKKFGGKWSVKKTTRIAIYNPLSGPDRHYEDEKHNHHDHHHKNEGEACLLSREQIERLRIKILKKDEADILQSVMENPLLWKWVLLNPSEGRLSHELFERLTQSVSRLGKSEEDAGIRLAYSIAAIRFYATRIGFSRQELADEHFKVLREAQEIIEVNEESTKQIVRQWAYLCNAYIYRCREDKKYETKIEKYMGEGLIWEADFLSQMIVHVK